MNTIRRGWSSLSPSAKVFVSLFLFYFMAKTFGNR